MQIARYDFKVVQGSDQSIPVTFRVNAETLYDLTGATAAMQIRLTKESSVAIDTLTDANSRLTINVETATINLVFPATASSEYDFSSALYDLEITKSGTKIRLLEGVITLDREVTRV